MCQDERSQYLNKTKCIKELRLRIEKYNYRPPKRIKTKPTRGSIERRLSTKKHKSKKKSSRKKLNLSNYKDSDWLDWYCYGSRLDAKLIYGRKNKYWCFKIRSK